jgi:hypothetical protein
VTLATSEVDHGDCFQRFFRSPAAGTVEPRPLLPQLQAPLEEDVQDVLVAAHLQGLAVGLER